MTLYEPIPKVADHPIGWLHRSWVWEFNSDHKPNNHNLMIVSYMQLKRALTPCLVIGVGTVARVGLGGQANIGVAVVLLATLGARVHGLGYVDGLNIVRKLPALPREGCWKSDRKVASTQGGLPCCCSS